MEPKGLQTELLDALSRITEEEQALLQGSALQRESYGSGAELVIKHKKMIARGKLIAIRPHTRFVSFPIHSHDYIELMYVCCGKVTHLMQGGDTVTVQAGEILLLNPLAHHAILPAQENDVAVNLMILPQFLEETFATLPSESALGQFLRGSLSSKKGEVHYLHFRVAEVLPIRNLMENLIWSLWHRQENRYRINRMTMSILFLQLQNHMELIEENSEVQELHPLLKGMYTELEENFSHADLTALAQKAGVSVSYYSQLIRRLTGRTFKELLWERRLEKSKELLLHSQLSVEDIIHFVGYENTAYFFRTFRKDMGMSPKDYRAFYGLRLTDAKENRI